ARSIESTAGSATTRAASRTSWRKPRNRSGPRQRHQARGGYGPTALTRPTRSVASNRRATPAHGAIHMTKSSEPPAPSAERTGFDWRQFASATCTNVDWTTVAQRALGSATLAMLVGGAVAMIGRAIEADVQAQRIAAARKAAEASVIDAEYEAVPTPE